MAARVVAERETQWTCANYLIMRLIGAMVINVSEIRTALGLDRQQMATRLGISLSHLSMIENAHREVTLAQAERLEAMTGRKDIVSKVMARLWESSRKRTAAQGDVA